MLKHFYHKQDNNALSVYGANWAAQSFTPDSSFTCSTLTLFLSRSGTPTGTLTYSVYATDMSGDPTGPALATTTADYSGVDTDFPGMPIAGDFSGGVALSSGTQYVLIVSLDGGNVSNYLKVTNKAAGDYAGGNCKSSADSGGSWADNARDLTFDLFNSDQTGVKNYFAMGNGVTSSTARFMRIYRDGSGNSTILEAASVSGTATNGTLRKSEGYIYAISSDGSNTYLNRWDNQLAKDTGYGEVSLSGILWSVDVSDDEYIGHGYKVGTRGYFRALDPAMAQTYTGGGSVAYLALCMAVSDSQDFLVHGYGNGSGGFVNGYRVKKTDGTSLLKFWVSAGQIYGMSLRASDGNAFCAAVDPSGTVATIREYLDDANSYVWTVDMAPYGGHPYQVVHDSDLDILYVGTNRAGGGVSTSLYKFNAATGAQLATYDTGGNARHLTLTRTGTLLVCGPTSTDADAGVSTLREIDTDLSVLWRFDENFAMNLGGILDTPITYEDIGFTVDGRGQMLDVADAEAPLPLDPVDGIVLGQASVAGPLVPLIVRPLTPLIEHLEFKTEIHRRLSRREFRKPLRKCPRLSYELKIADKNQFVESYLLDRAMDDMAIPCWHEPSFTSQPIVAGDDHVHVATTAQTQFLAGHWAVIVGKGGRYDVMEIDSVLATQIVFTGMVTQNYPTNTEVIPVERCWAENIRVSKQLQYAVYDMKLAVAPVDTDLGLTTYSEGELSLTTVNYSSPLMESWSRPAYRRDGGQGLMSQTVIAGQADRGGMLRFVTHNRAELWSLRSLLYRLQGRAVAFHLATFAEELTPNAPLAAGVNLMNIEYCGYAEHVQNRRNKLRIHLSDGSVLFRAVLSSQVVVPGVTERLTLSDTWPSTIQPEDVTRIEYLDLVRIASDDVVIHHTNALGWASCEVPVMDVEPSVAYVGVQSIDFGVVGQGAIVPDVGAVSAGDKQESYEEAYTAHATADGNTWRSQGWLATEDYTLTGLAFYGAFTDQGFWGEIWSDDGAGSPLAVLASGFTTQTGSTGGDLWRFVAVDTPLAVTTGTAYHIVLHAPPLEAAVIRSRDTDMLYADGESNVSADAGATWGAPNAAADFLFQIWGTT